MRAFRDRTDLNPSRSWLIDPLSHTWGGQLSRADMLEAISGVKYSEKQDSNDSTILKKFIRKINRTSPAVILVPEFTRKIEDVLPAKAAVLDHLIALSKAAGTWKIPTHNTLEELALSRQPTEEVLSKIETRIFTLGKDKPEKITAISEWLFKKFQKTEEIRPIGVVGIGLISFECTRQEYTSLSQENTRGQSFEFRTTESGETDDTPGRIPIKIVLSDGITWCVVFQHEVRRISRGVFKMENVGVPDQLVTLLKKIPAVTGHYVKHDVLDLEDWVRACTGDEKFAFNAFVDVQALATLAGFNCAKVDSTILPFLAAGIVAVRFYDWQEETWKNNWKDLPYHLQWDLLAQMRCYTYEYTTFLYSLLYEVLPDSDVITQLTRSTTFEIVDWWAALIVSVLNGVYPPTRKDRDSILNRQRLIHSLVVNAQDGTKTKQTPYRVQQMTSLLGDWPPITKGGARFLRTTREHFLTQYLVFQNLQLPGFENLFSRSITPVMRIYARFGTQQELICGLNQRSAVNQRDTSLHLECHPALKSRMIDLRITDLSYKALHDEGERLSRPLRDLILEWFRLNINRIPHLFDVLTEDQTAADVMYPYYEKIRVMFMNLGRSNPIVVQDLEARLEQSRHREHAQINEKLEKVQSNLKELQEAEKELLSAIDLIRSDDTRGSKSDRTEYRDHSTSIPTLKHIKKKRPNNRQSHQVVPPLHQRAKQNDAPILPPELPRGNPSWVERQELVPAPPDNSIATMRSRYRSTTRPELHTFRKLTSTSRHNRRSSSRNRRSSHRSRSPARRSRSPCPGSSSSKSTRTQRIESPTSSRNESLPRSPRIYLDYPSPEVMEIPNDDQQHEVQVVVESVPDGDDDDKTDDHK